MKLTVIMNNLENDSNDATFSLNESGHVAYGSAYFIDEPDYCVDRAPNQEDLEKVCEAVNDDSIEKEVAVDFGPFTSKETYCERTSEWAEDHGFNCDDVCQIMGDGTTCKEYRGEKANAKNKDDFNRGFHFAKRILLKDFRKGFQTGVDRAKRTGQIKHALNKASSLIYQLSRKEGNPEIMDDWVSTLQLLYPDTEITYDPEKEYCRYLMP